MEYTKVVLFPVEHDKYKRRLRLIEYETWLKENNVKYSLFFNPVWSSEPNGVTLRSTDAVVFKLFFGL